MLNLKLEIKAVDWTIKKIDKPISIPMIKGLSSSAEGT